MRATHKHLARHPLRWNGTGPPGPAPQPVSYYHSPPRPGRTLARRAAGVAGLVALALLAVVLGGLGGAFLWFDQTVSALQAHSPAVKRAERQLAVALPGQPSIALVLGDNQRAGFESSAGGRSDTIMLDPRRPGDEDDLAPLDPA